MLQISPPTLVAWSRSDRPSSEFKSQQSGRPDMQTVASCLFSQVRASIFTGFGLPVIFAMTGLVRKRSKKRLSPFPVQFSVKGTAEADLDIDVGRIIEIHDLTSARGQNLNGHLGIVREQHQKADHWVVQLLHPDMTNDGNGQRFAIPVECLRPVMEDCKDLVDVPDKGLGFCAMKDISAGQIIHAEAAFVGAYISHSDLLDKCQTKLAKESPDVQKDIMSLSKGHLMSSMAQPALLAILENNSFRCVRDPDVEAFYVKASRFNHSCCPNAIADTSIDRVIIRALQDIEAGEEICISYFPLAQTLQQRQRGFLGKGFQCSCGRCREEERDGDPQFAIPCKCRRHTFHLRGDNAMFETGRTLSCSACGFVLETAASLQRLEQVQQMNFFMQSQDAATTHPAKLVELLDQAVDAALHGTNPAPRGHLYVRQLLNNLANAHYFFSTRVPGPHQASSMHQFVTLKTALLEQEAQILGTRVRHRDLNYFQSSHRLLMANFSDPKQKQALQKEMEDLCSIHFGQRRLPEKISAKVHI